MPLTRDDMLRIVRDLETQMKKSAKLLDFERAALLRDRIVELRQEFAEPVIK